MHKICEICKKAPATVHLTDIHNNVKTEVHMCESCAESRGITINHGASLQEVLGAIHNKEESPKKRKKVEEDPVCEECETKWSEFRAGGRFGCPQDYQAFRKLLIPLLEDIHGHKYHHVGKHPGEPDESSRIRREIVDTQRLLREAVRREHYEEAATLRDRLASLEDSDA